MNIKISDDRKISTIQREFNNLFPYLKLEFFKKMPNGESSSKNLLRDPSLTIGACRKIHTAGKLSITSEMTVTDLEGAFSKIYGLSVQVFRKSGKVWLETSVTDHWTLDLQNKQGESLSDKSRLNHTESEAAE
jgi:hypothetical protein